MKHYGNDVQGYQVMLDLAEYRALVERFSMKLIPDIGFDAQSVTWFLQNQPYTVEFREWVSCLSGTYDIKYKVSLNYVNYTVLVTPWMTLSSGKDLILFKMVWAQSLTSNSFVLA